MIHADGGRGRAISSFATDSNSIAPSTLVASSRRGCPECVRYRKAIPTATVRMTMKGSAPPKVITCMVLVTQATR